MPYTNLKKFWIFVFAFATVMDIMSMIVDFHPHTVSQDLIGAATYV
jgi:hypothetical protein